MENQNNKASHRYFKIITYCILFIAFLIFIVGIWIRFGMYESLLKEQESKIFICKFINSVLANTDFYKNNSSSDVIKDVENCRDLMSRDYRISTIDYSWEIYEAFVLFNDKTKIKVDVTFGNNKPFLIHFRKLKEHRINKSQNK